MVFWCPNIYRNFFFDLQDKPKMVLYPELIMNQKLPLGHKELWPMETQIWVISKVMAISFLLFFLENCACLGKITHINRLALRL